MTDDVITNLRSDCLTDCPDSVRAASICDDEVKIAVCPSAPFVSSGQGEGQLSSAVIE